MKQALALLFVIAAGFIWAEKSLGYRIVYEIGYGALTLMALMISGTFLWLWSERATPLALGMAYSWAGAAGVLGWWWFYHLLDAPNAMVDSEVLFLLLSLYFVGAILHFAVITRSLTFPAQSQVVPVAIAAVISALVHLLT